MVLSDLSIKRPVICLVASILILLVGALAFKRLPVREYPNTDSPIVSVETTNLISRSSASCSTSCL